MTTTTREAPNMNKVLVRVEDALRKMTWSRQDTAKIHPGMLSVFDGVSIAAKLDGLTLNAALSAAAEGETWTGMVLSYRDVLGDVRYEGAATSLNEGLIVRLTPGLAELAHGLATKGLDS